MAETSKTTDLALSILLELSEYGPLTPVELGKRLDLNRTVVYRLVSTLRSRGFVIRNGRGYLPGPVFLRIAERVRPELRAAASDIIRGLSQEFGETVVMHIADGDDALVLDEHVGAAHVLRVAHATGSRHPLDKGASGRALLAFMSKSAIGRALRNAEDPVALDAKLKYVRELGYATSHDELQNGVHGLAVPIFGPGDLAIASLAVIVPIGRPIVLPDTQVILKDAASRVASALGGSSDPDLEATPLSPAASLAI